MEKYPNINKINSPSDIKSLSIRELNNLSLEIREFIIDKVSTHGGHLSSNLGVVEATIALHYVFNSPKDKIIFDVGHQCYTHKILTGRSKDFDNFRKFKGMSGFPKYNESVHDVYETGHSSTSISAMCGFLEEKKKDDSSIGEVISFIGDGSVQSGLALAGINHLASLQNQKGIIIINDNEMSISKNVGGFAKYFNKVRIRKSFTLLRKITTVNLRKLLKSIIYRDVNLFGQLRYTYLGPIDGHDINELIKYFTYAKNFKHSIVIHIKTVKGKGYKFAEDDVTGMYHGIGPFNKETGKVLKVTKENHISFSNAVGNILDEVLEKNPNPIIITPAMIYGTGLTNVSKKYPSRVIDVGICEENAVVMASSLARTKTIPIVCTYATFFQRAYDAFLHDISRTNAHSIFLSDRAGIVSFDGDTHQGIFDIPMFNTLPNFVIAAPSNVTELKDLIYLGLSIKKPFYIRYPKCDCLNIYDLSTTNFGKWKIIKELGRKNVITFGPVVNEFKEILRKTNIGLINALFIKPLDLDLLRSLKGKRLYIYEDSYLENGLGQKIIEISHLEELDLKVKRFGLKDYVGCGSDKDIRDHNFLNVSSIVNMILND